MPRATLFTPPSPAPLSPLAIVTAVGLLLTGCTTDPADDDVAAPETSPTEAGDPTGDTSPDPSPTAASSPTPVPPVETPALDTQCEIEPDLPEVERVTYAVPSSWQVEGSCDVLDPDLEELPEQTEVTAAAFVSVSEVAYSRTVEPGASIRDVTDHLGARAGFQALRRTGVTTGEVAREEGQPVTVWFVDLDAGTDEQGGVFSLTTGGVEGQAYDLAQATVDRIAQTVVVEPPAEDAASAPGATSFTVVRSEGGATPYAVTYDGDCFALRPGSPTDDASDEVCDLDPTAGDVVTGVLGGDVLVGYAPPTAIAVEATGGTPPFGLTSAVEGGSVFAFRVAEVPDQVTAIGAGGHELASGPVG